MRSQLAILDRFLETEDVFNTQKSDLSNFLEFEIAKPLLSPDAIHKIESKKDKWIIYTDPVEQILQYLPFAYDKARNKRGLSSARSLLHMRSWIWLTGDEEFYQEFESMVGEGGSNNVGDYGISVLDKISEKYGYVEV